VQAPVAAPFPSFDVKYAGFSGEAAIADSAAISWQTPDTNYQIYVFATEAFQSGSENLAIPDLTSMAGFLAPPPSGTIVGWSVGVYGGSYFPFMSVPSSGSLSFASDGWTYKEP
jgi:hypothetical protein